ncbi:MAG TPA: FAD-linked oxidase C-terminal domain-containing protein [Blastocatellia bacterium]|nr:FAD-linked oxidase C-terminal domain-containing protein [Blastocatellia bacterium]
MTQTLDKSVITELHSILGKDAVVTDEAELMVYECDAITTQKIRPLAVLFPSTTEQVSRTVRLLSQNGIAFGPRGAGTGLSSGALALGCEKGERAVTIEMARMNRILEIDYANQRAIVQPGVINVRLSQAVAASGYYYAPDPSSQTSCTLGGNVAENSGGPHCLKYGMTTNHILGLEVVLPDGEIISLGGHGADAVGYDLLGTFVGSEGTFGIATKITVRLARTPQIVVTLLADFLDLNDASRAVSAIIAAGILPAALEMIDKVTINAVEDSIYAAGYPRDAAACLIVELDGLRAGMNAQVQRAIDICCEHGARSVREARDEVERKKLWAGRKGAFGALGRVSPDLFVQDSVVPRTRLPEVLAGIYAIGAKYNLRLSTVFHAGDGNLHPNINFDGRDKEEVERVHKAGREIMKLCVEAGGSITGEHGVGVDKINYMPMIFDQASLEAMLAVKEVFNPTGLCNPGKAVPAQKMCREHKKGHNIVFD